MSLALISQSYLLENDEGDDGSQIQLDKVAHTGHEQDMGNSPSPEGVRKENEQSESPVEMEMHPPFLGDINGIVTNCKIECASQSPSSSTSPYRDVHDNSDVSIEDVKVPLFKLESSHSTLPGGEEITEHLNKMHGPGSQVTQTKTGRKSSLAQKQRRKGVGPRRPKRSIPIDRKETPLLTPLWNNGSSNNNATLYRAKHRVIRKKSFQCDQCGFAFTFLSNLSRHIKNAHAKTETGDDWKCSHCPLTFSSPASVKYHENHGHRQNGNNARSRGRTRSTTLLECKACGKDFVSIYSLAVHVYNHKTQGQGPIKCLICNYVSIYWSNAVRHLRTIHGEKKTIRGLKPMGSCYSSKYLIRDLRDQPHSRINSLKQLRPCKIILARCDNLLLSKPKIGTTRDRITVENIPGKIKLEENTGAAQPQRHGNGRIYKCPFCFELFLQAANLITHLPIHSDQGDSSQQLNYRKPGRIAKSFCCRHCQYSCKTLQRLEIHMKHHQQRGKRFRCSLCICYFKTFKAMRIHMGHLHKGGRTQDC